MPEVHRKLWIINNIAGAYLASNLRPNLRTGERDKCGYRRTECFAQKFMSSRMVRL